MLWLPKSSSINTESFVLLSCLRELGPAECINSDKAQLDLISACPGAVFTHSIHYNRKFRQKLWSLLLGDFNLKLCKSYYAVVA